MNCQSIKNKKPELQTIVNSAKPTLSWVVNLDSPWISQTRKYFLMDMMLLGRTGLVMPMGKFLSDIKRIWFALRSQN